MFSMYMNGFSFSRNSDSNEFVEHIIRIAENYIAFLVSRNRLYLPDHLDAKDTAIDLIAELFKVENNIFVKFRDFFQNNFAEELTKNEDDYEKYLRGFIYSVIQNNLINLYKESDPITCNIHRNIREAAKNLNFHISIHFSDKYIHQADEITTSSSTLDREELLNLVHSSGLVKNAFNTREFIKSLFEILEANGHSCPALRISDIAYALKSVMAVEIITRDGALSESEHQAEKLNIKFILNDVRFAISEKMNRYAAKNNLPKNFIEGMYNIIDEILTDLSAGNKRKSVMDLMKAHFNKTDKNLFYKIQYCIELLELEIAKNIEKERLLIA